MCVTVFVRFISILIFGHSYAAVLKEKSSSTFDLLNGNGTATKCDTGYTLTCFKLDAIKMLEKLSTGNEYNLLPGVRVVRDLNVSVVKNEEIVSEMARNFPTDKEKRLDGFLEAKLDSFLHSHALSIKLLDAKALKEAFIILISSDGKMDGKKWIFKGLILAVVVIIGVLGVVAFGVLGFVASKALLAAFLALLVSSIIGFTTLIVGQKPVTYEIRSKPVYTKSKSYSPRYEDIHIGYGHSGQGHPLTFDLPQNLDKNL